MVLDESQVYERLTKVFQSVFYDDDIALRPGMTAEDIEGWDSANHINLIVAAETEFGMQFDTSELEGLDSVADLVVVIRKRGV